MRFTTVTAVAAVAVLTACNASNSLPSGAASTVCRPHAQQSFSSIPQNATLTPRTATAARLGLWPRQGPSVRVCGDLAAGFARCQAWLRTDIEGPITPDTPAGYAPSDLQTAYGLTSDSQNNGGGQTVAVVDAYDDPNVESDLNVYRAKFGLPACTISNGCFTKQKYTSQTNPSWAAEESVDVEMVSAICPNCKILLVEAASTSTADLRSAEQYATSKADYVSDSWSTPEGTQTYDGVYTGCGTIVAATGDHGYSATATWPAILPSVVGVGGTSLKSTSPRAETAWLQAGSGCSKIYGKPSFQSSLRTGCSMRAESDVSADADPQTGVAIYDTFDRHGWLVFGGTSVATPIVASVFALAGNA
ncbi:MAG: S8 family serine peptidase, partial [Candidatus Cybelea sp.]